MLPIASPIKYPFSPPYNSIVDMLDILKVAKLILLIDCRFESNTKIFPFKVPIKISILFLDYKKFFINNVIHEKKRVGNEQKEISLLDILKHKKIPIQS